VGPVEGVAELVEEGLPVVDSIENGDRRRIILLRRSLDDILQRMDSIERPKHSAGGTVEELIAAIGDTQESIAEFSKIVEAIALMDDTEALKERLEQLKEEHRDLDDVISRLVDDGAFNQIKVQRLKKRKLALKDQIAQVENRLLPDIIA